MLSHSFFDDAMYQMERMRRHMFRNFERSLGGSSLGLLDDDFDDFGLTPFRRNFFRPLRHEPDLLAIRDSIRDSMRNAIREPRPEEIGENGAYYAKYEINDNGHVYKKTIEKEPGKDWKTHVEEYDVKPALKHDETKQLKNSQETTSKSSPVKSLKRTPEQTSSKKSPEKSPRTPEVKSPKNEEQQKNGSGRKSVSGSKIVS